MVSGLHASVNMHVSRNFYDAATNSSRTNHNMYLNSIGKHEDRVKNLFFVYAAALRAVNIGGEILKNYNYKTGLDPI
jgi:hypothetical protein